MKKGIKATLLAVTLVAAVLLSYPAFLFVVHDFNPDFMKIDSCLDRGGSWNYQTRQCEFEDVSELDVSYLLEPPDPFLDLATEEVAISEADPRYIWDYIGPRDPLPAIVKQEMEG